MIKNPPALEPHPVQNKNIYSWSGSCWKTSSPDGVDSCTPAPANLW